jgi:hypothetical protein
MLNKYLVYALILLATGIYCGIKGHSIGVKETNAVWLKKQVIEVSAAAQRLKELHEAARAKESLAVIEYKNVADKLQEAKDEINNMESTINQQRDAIVQLRFGNALPTNRSESSTVTANTIQCGEKTVTELSREVFDYLYNEATRADEITEQLSACQSLLN